MEKMIINDSIDLSIKKPTFYKDFYKSGVSSDASRLIKSSNSKRLNDIEFYAIASVSGKEINNRLYSNDSWEKTVVDKKWKSPYRRPILVNHDLGAEPLGRIESSFLINHDSMEVISQDEGDKIPNKVIKHFKNKKAFDDGTSCIIVKFYADEETGNKIIDGFYETVSQSSIMKKASCSICGKDYFNGDCSHYAGKTYEIEGEDKVTRNVKCLVKTEDYEPVELSIVNYPANDTSTIVAYGVKENKIITSDMKEDIIPATAPAEKLEDNSKIDDTKKTCENTFSPTKDEKEVQVNLYKEMAKDYLKNMVVSKVKTDEASVTSFEVLFDSLEENQVKLLQDFLSKIEKKEVVIEAKTDEKVEEKTTEKKATEDKVEIKSEITTDAKKETTIETEKEKKIEVTDEKNEKKIEDSTQEDLKTIIKNEEKIEEKIPADMQAIIDSIN